MSATTFTHVGRRASIGYTHVSVTGFMHNSPRAGRTHALNVGTSCYVALCGEVVSEYTHDHRCTDERNPVCLALAADAPKVTCKRCRKVNAVAVPVAKRTRHVVFLALCTGEISRWSTEPTPEMAERYAASIAERGKASTIHPDGYVLNAWAETRTE